MCQPDPKSSRGPGWYFEWISFWLMFVFTACLVVVVIAQRLFGV